MLKVMHAMSNTALQLSGAGFAAWLLLPCVRLSPVSRDVCRPFLGLSSITHARHIHEGIENERLLRAMVNSRRLARSSCFSRLVCTQWLAYDALPFRMRTACTIPSPSNLQCVSVPCDAGGKLESNGWPGLHAKERV